MSLSRKEMLNFARLLDDLFNSNLFFSYCISHKEDKNIFNVLESIETIVNEAITKTLTEDGKNLLFERYGIGGYTDYVPIFELAKNYGVSYSIMSCTLESTLFNLNKDENVGKLKNSFFSYNIDEGDFLMLKEYFDEKFVEMYYDKLRNTENAKHFKIWEVFERYSEI